MGAVRTFICENCGTEYRRAAGDEGRGRFCSVRCGRAAQPMASREERFWAKVQKSDGCWEWQGAKTTPQRGGFRYGKLRSGSRGASRVELAHRVSWELSNGSPVPPGSFICHHCDNSGCVRPDHLFVGAPADNTADRDRKLRQHRKLDPAKVQAIRLAVAVGGRQAAIAEAFGVSQSVVHNIAHRRTWKHVP